MNIWLVFVIVAADRVDVTVVVVVGHVVRSEIEFTCDNSHAQFDNTVRNMFQ